MTTIGRSVERINKPRFFRYLERDMLSKNPWIGTHPRFHDSRDFRYLVHAIKSPNDISAAVTATFMLSESVRSNSTQSAPVSFTGSKMSLSDALRKKITGRALSCSLISPQCQGLWANQGLILSLDDPRLVLATSSSDLGAHVYSLEAAKRQLAGRFVASPAQLLSSRGFNYNEVVISGENPPAIKVLGVVVLVDSLGFPRDSYGYGQALIRKAEADKLPVVFINPKSLKGAGSNDVYIYREAGGSEWVKSTSLTPEQKSEITAVSYYDEETGAKYHLCLYRSGGSYSIGMTPQGDLDTYFNVGPADCLDTDRLFVNYWNEQKLRIARDILVRMKQGMPEIFASDIYVKGGERLSDLFEILMKIINNPTKCYDANLARK